MEKAPQSSRFVNAKIGLICSVIITIILITATLKLTTEVTLPIIIAILLTLVLEPIVAGLEKIKIPRVIGAIIIVLMFAIAVYFIGLILIASVKTVLTMYPKYEERFTNIYIIIADTFTLPYDEHISLFQNLWRQLGLREKLQSYAISFSSSFASFLSKMMMVVLFLVFLLLEVGHFKKRIEVAFAGKISDSLQHISSLVITQVARYLSVKFFVSLATGLLVWLALTTIGLDFAVIWGVIAFILNFIPNIGSIAVSVFVSVFALVQFWPQPGPVIAAIVSMFSIEMILGNILEPRIQGQNLGISPFIILVSLSIWGWIWGFAGLILSVPMTVIIRIICDNIEGLKPIAIMMSSYKDVKKQRHFSHIKKAQK